LDGEHVGPGAIRWPVTLPASMNGSPTTKAAALPWVRVMAIVSRNPVGESRNAPAQQRAAFVQRTRPGHMRGEGVGVAAHRLLHAAVGGGQLHDEVSVRPELLVTRSACPPSRARPTPARSMRAQGVGVAPPADRTRSSVKLLVGPRPILGNLSGRSRDRGRRADPRAGAGRADRHVRRPARAARPRLPDLVDLEALDVLGPRTNVPPPTRSKVARPRGRIGCVGRRRTRITVRGVVAVAVARVRPWFGDPRRSGCRLCRCGRA
jgi:hypothetical protein